jgi:hypothetical protein
MIIYFSMLFEQCLIIDLQRTGEPGASDRVPLYSLFEVASTKYARLRSPLG